MKIGEREERKREREERKRDSEERREEYSSYDENGGWGEYEDRG